MKGLMESPKPGSRKRAFPGESSSSGLKGVRDFETTPSVKVDSAASKQKKVVPEIIDLDVEEDCGDVMLLDGQADIKGKCKEILEISDDDNGNGEPSDENKPNIVSFKKFDTVEDYSDHHYAEPKSCEKTVKQPNWAKRIQEEWKILEEHLPDTIFVRVYESRMDLLRAVILGAEGTPYHNGLFFFDIHFPGDYPDAPPQVHYHSGGLYLNPNLYEDGYVCLSLLNTWNGNENEMWMKGKSTILQVLVSIQGLILNAEPYFNEPGYEMYRGTEHSQRPSMEYNETALIDSLKTMVYSMNKPPMHFEPLVVEHFAGCAQAILSSCRAFLKGAQGAMGCSEGFKTRLGGFISTLVNALTSIGAKDCEEFLFLARVA